MEKRSRITELDGLRVIMIFIVSWYHIWQQSWMTPVISIPALNIWWSLDWLVRSGYVWVDGTVLLSAFLLYLPLARQEGRGIVDDPVKFYRRKAIRLLPGFWFIILVFFFGMCLPYGLYHGDGPYMVKDLFTHFTLIFPFWRDTYIWTPLGAAPWTLSLVAQGYLLFPLLAKGMKKNPGLTLGLLTGFCFAFRAWCVWGMNDYSMVVNCLPNFLDVYALGFAAALLFAKLERRDGLFRSTGNDGDSPYRSSRKRAAVVQLIATVVFIGCVIGLCEMLKVQARSSGQTQLQEHQMLYRPVFALAFAGMILSAPFIWKPLRWLLGNKVMVFLSTISMSYYLIHQTLAVHLKRLAWPPSLSDMPNTVGEQPWQWQYTLAAFGLSLLAAILVTYGIEKPFSFWLSKKKRKGSP